jgi:hypothetical protein
MNMRSGRDGDRCRSCTHKRQALRPRLLGQVARDEPLVAMAPRAAAVLGQPHADGGHREREPVRDRRARGRWSAGTGRRLPASSRPGRVLPQRALQGPGRAAVGALEQDARVAAGVQGPVALAGHDHPDPLERRVPALGEGDALGLVPGAVGVLGPPELGPVEGRRHGGQQPARARVAHGVLDGLARERARPHGPRPASAPLEREQALLRAHEELRHVLTCLLRSPEGRPPRRPGQRRVPAPLLPVDEDVEVAPQVPALVEHPPAQAGWPARARAARRPPSPPRRRARAGRRRACGAGRGVGRAPSRTLTPPGPQTHR